MNDNILSNFPVYNVTSSNPDMANGKKRKRNNNNYQTKLCLRFLDDASASASSPKRVNHQTLKSPLMPTLAETGRGDNTDENVVSLTYSVSPEIMKSIQDSQHLETSLTHQLQQHQLSLPLQLRGQEMPDSQQPIPFTYSIPIQLQLPPSQFQRSHIPMPFLHVEALTLLQKNIPEVIVNRRPEEKITHENGLSILQLSRLGIRLLE